MTMVTDARHIQTELVQYEENNLSCSHCLPASSTPVKHVFSPGKIISKPVMHTRPTVVEIQVQLLFHYTTYLHFTRGKIYIGHGCLCVCLSLPCHIPTLLHRPGCNLEEW